MELQANGTFAILNSWTWPSLEHLEEKCKWSLKSCNTKTILKWTHIRIRTRIRIRQRVWFYIYFPWGWSLTCECQGADVVEPVAALRRRRAHSLLSQDHRSSISHYAASHHLRGFPEGFLLDIFYFSLIQTFTNVWRHTILQVLMGGANTPSSKLYPWLKILQH